MMIAQYLNPSLADDPQECPAWYQSGRALKKKKKKEASVGLFSAFRWFRNPIYRYKSPRGETPLVKGIRKLQKEKERGPFKHLNKRTRLTTFNAHQVYCGEVTWNNCSNK